MLKAIGSSVVGTGAFAVPDFPTTHFPPSGIRWRMHPHPLHEALHHLSNVRVDVLPSIHERRPGGFVGDAPERATRGPFRRQRFVARLRPRRNVPHTVNPRGDRHSAPVGSDADTLRSDGASTTDAPWTRDDVSREPLSNFSVTASLSLRKLEEALSRCANPVSGLVRDAQMLYAVASDRTLSANTRRYLQQAGQIVDFVSGFDPTLAVVRGVCSVGARSLEILRGSPVTEADLSDISLTMKDAMRRFPTEEAHPQGDVVDIQEPSQAGEDAPGPSAIFEVNYAEVADEAVEAVGEVEAAGDVDGAGETAGEAAGETAGDAAGDAADTAAEASGVAGAPANADAMFDTGASIELQEPLLDEDVATLPKPCEIDRAGPPGAMRAASSPLSHTMIDAVPIIYVGAEGSLPARWRRVPLSDYAEHVQLPEKVKNGRRFNVFGVEFIQLDGHAYPFYQALPDNEFIYSVSHPELPPLPLARQGAVRVLKEPSLVAVQGIPVFPGNDGFIRMNNKRYVMYGQIVVEADRPQLIGEVQIEQSATAIDVVLSGPDANGLIHTPSGWTVIEGSAGYYRVRQTEKPETAAGQTPDAAVGDSEVDSVGDAQIDFDVLDRNGDRIGVQVTYDRGLRRWSIGADLHDAPLIRERSRDSLDIYQAKLDWSLFLRQRPMLQEAVSSMLDQLHSYNLHRPNRLSPREPGSEWITNIYTVRQSIQEHLRATPGWEKLSVKEKQRTAAEASWRFFNDNRDWTWAPGAQAFCSEMLDIAHVVFNWAGIHDRHLLQIVFREVPGSGRNHVAMLYSDDPAVFRLFGHIDLPEDRAALRSVDERTFADWLLEHRDTVAIIDPWGPEKVNDFSVSRTRSDIELKLTVNLREAKFNVLDPVRFRVGVLVPSRQGKADQRAAGVASRNVAGEQKLPCALLDGCLR